MTVIEKLSDRNGLIFNAIKLILVNEVQDVKKDGLNAKQLQYKLFQAGIYIDGPKLAQALSVMNEKGQLTNPKPDEVLSEESKA